MVSIIERLLRGERGQTLVEFALVFPVFLMLFVGMMDYSRYSTADMQVTNATQEAAKEFVIMADTPKYREWYVEDIDKIDDEKRINNELKGVVVKNTDTILDENITLRAKWSAGDDVGTLGDRVSVKVTAIVPSLSNFSFRDFEVEREVTLRIPSFE